MFGWEIVVEILTVSPISTSPMKLSSFGLTAGINSLNMICPLRLNIFYLILIIPLYLFPPLSFPLPSFLSSFLPLLSFFFCLPPYSLPLLPLSLPLHRFLSVPSSFGFLPAFSASSLLLCFWSLLLLLFPIPPSFLVPPFSQAFPRFLPFQFLKTCSLGLPFPSLSPL